MFVNLSMTLPSDLSCLSPSEKDTLIGVLMARLAAREARVSALEGKSARLAHGFVYLVAVIDWYSRRVLVLS